MNATNLYAVILAGGSGTRLWPRSRGGHPKQFLDLAGDRTMIQQTVNRVRPLIPLDRIYFLVGSRHAAQLREQLPGVPANNVIVEPSAKGTGPCVGLAAMLIRQRDPNATMTSLHADHFIRDEAGFRTSLQTCHALAQRGLLVTMGAAPTYPETGYGYIERGDALEPACAQAAYRIARFTEKPDRDTAERMMATGRYYWNTGMFTWRVDTILDAFRQHMPAFSAQLDTIAQAPEQLPAIWTQVVNETIDRGIMERATNAAVLPIDIGWSDIGSWASLHDLLPADANGNVVLGDHVAIDTHGSFIRSNGKLIATLGVSNLIVVETDDAILICPKDRAQDVKLVVDQLKADRRDALL
ncbi:MAG: mannose-1-phosphate guanylyltransferase [Chloroflexi bacterium]|nr:mannose-1-phosphate guanylyltransferase [Chloroflexota bacterium]